MDIVAEHRKTYNFFYDITGVAMMVTENINQGCLKRLMRLRWSTFFHLKGIVLSIKLCCPCIGKRLNLTEPIAWIW